MPSAKEAPSTKTDMRADCSGLSFWGLVFEIWTFSGALGLVLEVSLGGGSKNRGAPVGRNGLRPRPSHVRIASVHLEASVICSSSPRRSSNGVLCTISKISVENL